MIEQDLEIVFNKRVAADTFFMGLRSPQIAAEARAGQFLMLKKALINTSRNIFHTSNLVIPSLKLG